MKITKMKMKFYNFFILVIITLLTASCNFSYGVRSDNQLSYSQQYIIFEVKDIEMIDRTDINTTILSSYPPPIDPKLAMLSWAEERLRASGNEGKVEFIVEAASFQETKSPAPKRGFIDSMNNTENNKYDARYKITMNLYTNNAKTNRTASITVESFSDRVIEGVTSPAEKDKILKEMLQEALTNAEAQLESNIKTYFAGYVKFKRSN